MEQLVTQFRDGMTPMMRVKPKAPAQYYKTYAITSPIETHYRRASCHEVDCANYLKGWVTVLDVSTVNGADTANWIRMKSGRAFTHTQAGFTVKFIFPPGQKCFMPHQVPVGRPELFVVQGGDWRGNPMSITEYKHKHPEDWVEDVQIHQDKIITAQQRG